MKRPPHTSELYLVGLRAPRHLLAYAGVGPHRWLQWLEVNLNYPTLQLLMQQEIYSQKNLKEPVECTC